MQRASSNSGLALQGAAILLGPPGRVGSAAEKSLPDSPRHAPASCQHLYSSNTNSQETVSHNSQRNRHIPSQTHRHTHPTYVLTDTHTPHTPDIYTKTQKYRFRNTHTHTSETHADTPSHSLTKMRHTPSHSLRHINST